MALTIVAAVLAGYALVAQRLRSTPLSGPLIFVAFGLLISQEGLGLFTLDLDDATIQALLKATLVLLLFTEASEQSVRRLSPEAGLPGRLLVIGMPLVIAFGTVTAWALFPGLTLWEAAVLAALLAPTDAALGQPVVTNKRVPGTVRRTLLVEAGLNDGLAVPFAYAFAAAAAITSSDPSQTSFLEFLLEQVLFGVVVGIAVGWLGAKAISYAWQKGWSTTGWLQIGFVGIAAVAFALAEANATPDGNGFIAAWVAGLAFARAKDSELHLTEFAARSGDLLTMVSFLVFGALLLAPALANMEVSWIVYALISLALIRPAAVFLAMIGSRLRLPTVAYIGWFGPRGIASLVLGTLVVKQYEVLTIDAILSVMTITVALSVLLHGVTAWPGAEAYGRWIERSGLGPLTRYRRDSDEAGPRQPFDDP